MAEGLRKLCAVFFVAAACCACAHAQQQSLPDSPVPSAPAAATPAPSKPDIAAPKLPPETVAPASQAAPAPQAAPAAKPNPASGDDFPFPEDSTAPVITPAANADKAPASSGNPAAEPPEPPTPKGFSSSESGLKLDDEGSNGMEHAADPARAKKDASVAHFYWNQGNYEGSYLRFKDAVVYAPSDPETWYGLAESERMLGKNVKARQDYEHYLQLAPQGKHAHAVTHELAKLPAADKVQPDRPGPKVP